MIFFIVFRQVYINILTILQVTGVIKGIEPSGFAATNGMAFLILVVLVVATIIPIINSKVKDAE